MDSTTNERWRPIPGHPGYEVSDLGQVRSLPRRIMRGNGHPMTLPGKILRPAPDAAGYMRFTLAGRKTRPVHRCVLAAFVGPCPSGMETLHENGDPSDNRLSNLRWGTHSENVQDAVAVGNHNFQRRKTCPLGHLLQAPNIPRAVAAHGYRKCLACQQTHSVVNGFRRRGNAPPDFRLESDRRYKLIMSGRTTQRLPRRRSS